MAQEFRMFGPPGTGKTTRLATRDIPKAVAKYGPDKILVTSFSRAAAREIAGRDLPIPPENVGTLHSFCFRALSNPEIAETHVEDWNKIYPTMRLSGHKKKGQIDKGLTSTEGAGEDLLNQLNIYRSRMTPRELWKPSVLNFYHKWERFKTDNNYLDFTDLIENTLIRQLDPPDEPKVMFVDEAQDFTPLQLSLTRQWAQNMDWLVLVGDDDQTIFSFTGASPDAFLNPPVPDNCKTVLRQSYRIPKTVHKRANKLISKVKYREEKEFAPREEDGCVSVYPETFKVPNKVIYEAEQYMKEGKSVMFLASCSYMLNHIINSLRDKGLPFHNPYRRTNGQWNPLSTSEKKLSAKGLLLNFLQKNEDDSHWTIPNLISWAKHIKVSDDGLIRKQGSAGLKALSEAVEARKRGLHTSSNVLGQILTPNAQEKALARDTGWFLDQLKATRQKSIKYPIKVYKEHGEKILTEIPKIIIGTIHSVKGSEADVVYLFPDISYNAMVEAHKRTENRDAIYRLFYVGMTRARERLVLMGPVSPQLQVIL